jgi:threonine dehydrogenase-like Zn-dependent dehydrogenase
VAAGANDVQATAAVLREFGQALDLAVVDIPALESGTALVDVVMAGLCGTDVHLQDGRLAIPLPVIPGHEAVGRIAALGEGLERDATGTPLALGDLVGWASSIPCGRCRACVQHLQHSLCPSRTVYGINQSVDAWPHASGAWAERIYLQRGTTVVKLPDSVSPLDVIALGCAGPTAVHGVVGLLKVGVGESVVVQGAGPVGLASAMLAKLAGARTVVVIGAPAFRLEAALAMGAADHVVDIQLAPDPGARQRLVRSLFGNEDPDVVVEATGVPAAVVEGIDLCRAGGRYLILGQYTDHGPVPLNPHFVTRKQLTVLGSWAFTGADYLAYVELLPALIQRFDPATLVTTFPLEHANVALDKMRTGQVVKPVIVPGTSER